MVSHTVLFCIFGVVLISSGNYVNAQANFNTSAGFKAVRYATGIRSARGLLLDNAGDILVVSNFASQIRAVYEENDTVSTTVIVENVDIKLNHGIGFNKGFLYASSESTVYRWPYVPGQRTGITTAPVIVVKNIPDDGHVSRTLIFDKNDLLYVSIGSGTNVDPDSTRARIRRFNMTGGVPNGGVEWNSGVVFADGLRNEVGLAFDEDEVLWGVQNGADELVRDDLGGDIHNTNPADEMTKYDQPIGTFYGYPYCWTVDLLANHTHGEQLAWPDFMEDGTHTDAWCKNVTNNHPPTLPLPAHNAALGITFYDGKACNSSQGAFPCFMKGDAFVTFHGSCREPPEGYKVVRIPIDPQTRLPTGEILDIMYEPDPAGCGRCFTPVDLVFNNQGHLVVSADVSSEVFRITYE